MPDQPEQAERRREALRAEVQKDLSAAEAYSAQHGSFADFVREHYAHGAVGDRCPRHR